MKTSISERLYSDIRQDILGLNLAPGSPLRLPSVTERYGVGATPLRECLNRLCSEQLVVPVHNKGFKVSALTRSDLLDLESSRNALEGAMFVHSVQHGGDDWEAGVVGAYHHLSGTPVPSVLQNSEELKLWTKRHQAFHSALVAGSSSVWMHRFSGQIEDQLLRYHLFIQNALRDLTQSAPNLAEDAATLFTTAMGLEPHQALFDAALSRDEVAARASFDAHTRISIKAFSDLSALMPADSPFIEILGPNSEAVL